MNSVKSQTGGAGIGRFLLGLLQILLYPRRGWEDAGKDNYEGKDLLARGLVPLLIVVALSSLCGFFYYGSVSLFDSLAQGILDFTGYFVSVYICEYLLSWGLKRWVFPMRWSQNKITTFVVYSVASMAVMTFLNNAFPADLALLSFLPLYVIYILWGGVEYMSVPEGRKAHFLAVSLGTVFMPPYLLSYCMSLFL